MKIAHITPFPHLELTEFGTIHMVLTHLVHKSAKYTAFYKNSPLFKLLDNGAFEGELHSLDSVLKAAEMIGADEIILPDELYDGEKTIVNAIESIQALKDKGLLGKYRLMAAVQGKTREEWWSCFWALHAIPEIDSLGLSKLSCPKAFNMSIMEARMHITHALEATGKHLDKQIHLLGGSSEVFMEVKAQPRWVRSLDTSAALEYARFGLSLEDAAAKHQDIKTHIDFELPVTDMATLELAERNMMALTAEACK